MKNTKKPKPYHPKPEKCPTFRAACDELGLPVPACASTTGEVVFAKEFGRIWRTDYMFTGSDGVRVAVELEGGVFVQGRHTRGAAFIEDSHKYNCYALMGIKLLRFTSVTVKKRPMLCAEIIKCLLYGECPAHLFEKDLYIKSDAIKVKIKKQEPTKKDEQDLLF